MLLYEKTKQEKSQATFPVYRVGKKWILGFEPEDVSVGQALIQLL